jgi:hypothetical protein
MLLGRAVEQPELKLRKKNAASKQPAVSTSLHFSMNSRNQRIGTDKFHQSHVCFSNHTFFKNP